MKTLVGVPVKPFTVAKARLGVVLDAGTRSRLGKAIAARTARCAAAAGAEVRIVTADPGVASWATELGFDVLAEEPGGLNGAAHAVANATVGPWAVLHADVPLVQRDELAVVLAAADRVIAPSHDGGTSLIKATGPFGFAYGPGSFVRHLARLPDAAVVTTPGLAFDLDTPRDLEVARRLRQGRWLEDLLTDAAIGAT